MPKLNDPQKSLGIGNSYDPEDPSTKSLNDYINLKLAAKGFEIVGDKKDYPFLDMSQSLLENYKQRDRLLSDHLCPVDKRIDDFVKGYLNEFPEDTCGCIPPFSLSLACPFCRTIDKVCVKTPPSKFDSHI